MEIKEDLYSREETLTRPNPHAQDRGEFRYLQSVSDTASVVLPDIWTILRQKI